MEFDVFSSPLPDVAALEVVQLVSDFSLDGAAGPANEATTKNDAARAAATTR